MQPVLEVIGAQVGAVIFKVDDYCQFVEGEEVIGLLVEVLLQVDDVVAAKVGARSFAEEDIASSVKGDDIPEAVLAQVFDQEVLDRHFSGPQLFKGILQIPVLEAVILAKRFAAARSQVYHFFGPADGMAEFVNLGVHADDVNVGVVDPTFQKDLVGPFFVY